MLVDTAGSGPEPFEACTGLVGSLASLLIARTCWSGPCQTALRVNFVIPLPAPYPAFCVVRPYPGGVNR